MIITSNEENNSAWMRAAVVDHIRDWWGGDAISFRRVQRCGDNICTDLLRKIGSDYSIMRNIRKDIGLPGISGLLCDRLVDWPTDLQDRAEFVIDLAKIAKKKDFTTGYCTSAFSKYLWFAKPHQWTMLDRYAASGLGCKEQDTINNTRKFYGELHNLNFNKVVSRMRKVIGTTDFDTLWPERIIDKYLMLCGGMDITKIAQDMKMFLDVIGKNNTSEINAISKRLYDEVGKEPLFCIHGDRIWGH